ncbi:hypothetical protein [Mameliella sp.]|uniref:hypothetical protein n=1 Tax=Mameliella sp. TaxID=1924940 RepID=UPI003B503468
MSFWRIVKSFLKGYEKGQEFDEKYDASGNVADWLFKKTHPDDPRSKGEAIYKYGETEIHGPHTPQTYDKARLTPKSGRDTAGMQEMVDGPDEAAGARRVDPRPPEGPYVSATDGLPSSTITPVADMDASEGLELAVDPEAGGDADLPSSTITPGADLNYGMVMRALNDAGYDLDLDDVDDGGAMIAAANLRGGATPFGRGAVSGRQPLDPLVAEAVSWAASQQRAEGVYGTADLLERTEQRIQTLMTAGEFPSVDQLRSLGDMLRENGPDAQNRLPNDMIDAEMARRLGPGPLIPAGPEADDAPDAPQQPDAMPNFEAPPDFFRK